MAPKSGRIVVKCRPMNEGEPRRFRLGESTGKPLGGNVAHNPFSQTLHELMAMRGFETQTALSRASGIPQLLVSDWIRGTEVPIAEHMGRLLTILQPDGEKLDALLDSWGRLLAENEKRRIEVKRKSALSNGRSIRAEAETAFDKWLYDFCDKRRIMLGEFFRPIGLEPPERRKLSLRIFSTILKHAVKTHCLDAEEAERLGEAVAGTIQEKLEAGHVFHDRPKVREAQSKLSCRTYNGAQAAEILGVSRQRVQVLREQHGLPLLLRDSDLEMIREGVQVNSRTKIVRL